MSDEEEDHVHASAVQGQFVSHVQGTGNSFFFSIVTQQDWCSSSSILDASNQGIITGLGLGCGYLEELKNLMCVSQGKCDFYNVWWLPEGCGLFLVGDKLLTGIIPGNQLACIEAEVLARSEWEIFLSPWCTYGQISCEIISASKRWGVERGSYKMFDPFSQLLVALAEGGCGMCIICLTADPNWYVLNSFSYSFWLNNSWYICCTYSSYM